MGAGMKAEGWEQRLSDAIEEARKLQFVWGHHDCATWAFDVRRALTGGPDVATWRGRYKTPIGSHRIMRKLGWNSLEDLGRELLGEPLVGVLMAQRGDLVLSQGDPAFGVCIGAQVAFVAPDGLTFLPLSECALAWRV